MGHTVEVASCEIASWLLDEQQRVITAPVHDLITIQPRCVEEVAARVLLAGLAVAEMGGGSPTPERPAYFGTRDRNVSGAEIVDISPRSFEMSGLPSGRWYGFAASAWVGPEESGACFRLYVDSSPSPTELADPTNDGSRRLIAAFAGRRVAGEIEATKHEVGFMDIRKADIELRDIAKLAGGLLAIKAAGGNADQAGIDMTAAVINLESLRDEEEIVRIERLGGVREGNTWRRVPEGLVVPA